MKPRVIERFSGLCQGLFLDVYSLTSSKVVGTFEGCCLGVGRTLSVVNDMRIGS